MVMMFLSGATDAWRVRDPLILLMRDNVSRAALEIMDWRIVITDLLNRRRID
jgi:hypothetical protein